MFSPFVGLRWKERAGREEAGRRGARESDGSL